jgi:hypothetical protein
MPSNAIGCLIWPRRKKPKQKTQLRELLEKTFDPESSQCSQVVPSSGAYAFEASKQTIQILQRFGNLLPVPCANEALELALLLMTAYEVRCLLEVVELTT